MAVQITVTPASGSPVTKQSRLAGRLTRTQAGWKLSALGQVPVGAAANGGGTGPPVADKTREASTTADETDMTADETMAAADQAPKTADETPEVTGETPAAADEAPEAPVAETPADRRDRPGCGSWPR